jgi:hypothetical protein
MKFIFKNKFWFSVCNLLFIAGLFPAMAQVNATDSTLLFQNGFNGNVWHQTKNLSLIKLDSIADYSSASFTFLQTQGSFKRPQQATKELLYGFASEGLKKYGNWHFFGNFSYQKLNNKEVAYSHVARPYDGNPFIWADTLAGDWLGDQLATSLQVSIPLKNNKWNTGLLLDYLTEQSARSADPKPLYRYRTIFLKPFISYQLSQKHLFGVKFSYQNKNEVNEIGNFSTNNPQLYRLRGYGTFSQGPIVTAERLLKGSLLGAGLNYTYQVSSSTLLYVDADYGFNTEDVTQGVSLPVFEGGLDETYANLYINFQKKLSRKGYQISALAYFRDGSGFDPVFNAYNSAFYFSGVNTNFSFWKKTNDKIMFGVKIEPQFSYLNYFDGIAKTDWFTSNLFTNASAFVNYTMNNKFSFNFSPNLGYNINMRKDIAIGRPTQLSEILVRPDYLFNSIAYLNYGLSASCLLKPQSANVSYQFKASIINTNPQDLQPNGKDFGYRQYINTSFSILF